MTRRPATVAAASRALLCVVRALAITLGCILFGAPRHEPGGALAQGHPLFLPALGRFAELRDPEVEFAELRHLGPVTGLVSATDTRFYLAMGIFVVLAEVQADGTLLPLGQSPPLGGEIVHLGTIDGGAWVITREQRMVVIDFDAPSAPRIVWDEPIHDTLAQVVQDGPWLYGFGVPRDIVIYDLRDGRHPREAGALDLGCQGQGGMMLHGKRLVVGCDGIWVIDVGDPAQARVAGHVGVGLVKRPPIVVDGVAFVDGQAGWWGVDLDDPQGPTAWPDPPPPELQAGWMVGDALYVPRDGIDIYRVDRRFKPERVSHLDVGSFDRSRVDRHRLVLHAKAIQHAHAGVITVLDVADPFAPSVVGKLQIPDNRRYQFHRYDGHAVYSITGCPIELGPVMPWPAPCIMPELFGGVLMVEGAIGLQWDRGTLIAHDLAATPPRRLWSVVLTDQPRGFEVDRQGDYLAVLIYGSQNPFRDVQVFVIALSGEQAGTVIGNMTPTPYAIQAMRITADGTVYLVHDLGIEATLIRGRDDVEVPLPMPHDEPAYAIRVEGDRLYALGRDGPLKRLIRVFDIADPSRPRLVNLVPVPRWSRTMEIFDGVAYVNSDVVLAIDVGAPPLAGRVIGVLHRPDAPWCQKECWRTMFKVGDQLMLHDTGSGFWLVRPTRRP